MTKPMRIFISARQEFKQQSNALIKLIADLTLNDLTDEEKTRVKNGEVIRVPADELLLRTRKSTSFK
jgi:hypothetical protein